MLHSVRVLFLNNMTFLVVAQQIYTKTAAKYHSLKYEATGDLDRKMRLYHAHVVPYVIRICSSDHISARVF